MSPGIKTKVSLFHLGENKPLAFLRKPPCLHCLRLQESLRCWETPQTFIKEVHCMVKQIGRSRQKGTGWRSRCPRLSFHSVVFPLCSPLGIHLNSQRSDHVSTIPPSLCWANLTQLWSLCARPRLAFCSGSVRRGRYWRQMALAAGTSTAAD